MITERHILFAQHAHPAWDGGWLGVQPQVIRFVKADNTVVNRVLIANVERLDIDACVGLLDQPVGPGIHVVPIMPQLSSQHVWQLYELGLMTIGVSQAPLNGSHESRVYPANAFGNFNDPIASGWGNSRTTSPFDAWRHECYPGDSGTPRFMLTPAGLALAELVDAVPASYCIDEINDLIEECDANAIQRGVLTNPTGLQVTVADFEIEEE